MRERLFNVLATLLEPLAALALATILTLGLTYPFLPTTLEARFPLRPIPAAYSSGEPDEHELVRRVEALGLAREARVVHGRSGSRLVLFDVESLEVVESPVAEALAQRGYRSTAGVVRRAIDMERLLLRDPRVLPILMTIQAAILLLGGLFLARWRIRAVRSARATGPVRAALIGLAGGVVALMLSAAVGAGLEALGLPVREQEWLEELFTDPRSLIRIAPWIILIGPVAEEVFFRGYAFRFITEHLGLPAGLIVSSVMFAAIHLNLSGFLIYLVIGCVLAWVYERTGSLVAPIVGHMTVNAVVLFASGLAGTAGPVMLNY